MCCSMNASIALYLCACLYISSWGSFLLSFRNNVLFYVCAESAVCLFVCVCVRILSPDLVFLATCNSNLYNVWIESHRARESTIFGLGFYVPLSFHSNMSYTLHWLREGDRVSFSLSENFSFWRFLFLIFHSNMLCYDVSAHFALFLLSFPSRFTHPLSSFWPHVSLECRRESRWIVSLSWC